jgi:hypothetical protein
VISLVDAVNHILGTHMRDEGRENDGRTHSKNSGDDIPQERQAADAEIEVVDVNEDEWERLEPQIE